MRGVKAFNRILLIVLCLSFMAAFLNISPIYAQPATLTFSSSTSDGDIRCTDIDYATARDSSSGDEMDDSDTCFTCGQNIMLEDYSIWRAFYFFNTSSIPDAATIIQVIFSLHIATSGTAEVNIMNTSDANPHDPLQLSDYNRVYYTNIFGTFDCNGAGTGYKNITLDSDANAWINKTGKTRFAVRSTDDINGVPPVGDKYVGISGAESGNPSKLYIIYSFYDLTISSSPSSVSFTLNGTSKTTPYSEAIVNGTYQINFTPSFYRDAGLWTFKWWADTQSTNPNRTINLQSDSSYSVVYTWTYVPPTIVTLKCDGHTEETTDWLAVGEREDALKEPNDGNYVYEDTADGKEGNFTFEDTSATGPINSVVLKIRCYATGTDLWFDIYVWDGTSFTKKDTGIISGSYSWITIDVSSLLTSWSKLNGAKIYLDHASGSLTAYVDCAKILVNPNVVHLHGLFDEDTGLMKAASERAVNVTVVLPGYTDETYVLNGSLDVAWTTPILYIQFNTSVPRQYWFSTAETGTGDPVTIYVFDTTLTTYTISFLDLAGLLDDYPFITAKRYINGSLTIVEKRKVDEEDKVVMVLKNGEKYNIVISDGVVGEAYVFGDLTVTSVTIIQLTLRGVDFPKATLLTYKYVRIYGDRAHGTPCGNITIFYQDLLNMTNNVQIYIDYKNGTNVYYAIITSNSSFIHVWASALNNTDYQVEVIIDHQRYGVYSWRQYFPRSLSQNPWGLDWFGNLPFDTALLIPFFLILFVGGCFSTINAEVGAVAMVITAIIVVYMWKVPIAPATLIVALTLAFLMAIIYAKRRVLT